MKLTDSIDRQEEHHRQRTFQDEYRSLLRKLKIRFDRVSMGLINSPRIGQACSPHIENHLKPGPSAQARMHQALGPLPSALCPLPSALCPLTSDL